MQGKLALGKRRVPLYVFNLSFREFQFQVRPLHHITSLLRDSCFFRPGWLCCSQHLQQGSNSGSVATFASPVLLQIWLSTLLEPLTMYTKHADVLSWRCIITLSCINRPSSTILNYMLQPWPTASSGRTRKVCNLGRPQILTLCVTSMRRPWVFCLI